jgi:hypothetical protein
MVVEPGPLSIVLAMLGLAVWVCSERLGWTTSTRLWMQRAVGAALWTMWQPIHDGLVRYRWQARRGRRDGVVIRRTA